MMALFALTAYFGLACFWVLPSIIAFRRQHPNRWIILAVNVVLGPPGWVIALIWVLYAVLHPASVSGASGGSRLNITFGGVSGSNDGRPESRPGSTGPMSTAALMAELERLSSLRAGGYIDEAEFAVLKAQLMASS